MIGRGQLLLLTSSIEDLNIIRTVTHKIQQFERFLNNYLAALEAKGTTVLKIIDRNNFDSIFKVWKAKFAPDKPPQIAALAYLLDLELKGIVCQITGVVLFDFEGDTKGVRLRVPVGTYEDFWSVYKRLDCQRIIAIYERKYKTCRHVEFKDGWTNSLRLLLMRNWRTITLQKRIPDRI